MLFRSAALLVYQRVLAQQQAVAELSHLVFLNELQGQQTDLGPALAKAREAGAATQSSLAAAPTVASHLGDAAQLLVDDQRRLDDVMKDQRAGEDGGDSPRLAALSGIQSGLDQLRGAVLRVGGGAMHDHDGHLALYTAGLQVVPAVHRQLWRGVRQGARVYTDVGRTNAAIQLLELASVTQQQLAGLQGQFDTLAASGMGDAGNLRRSLDTLVESTGRMKSLAQAALAAPNAAALAQSQRLSRDAFMQQTHAAQQIAWALQGQLLDMSVRAQQARWQQAVLQAARTGGFSGASLLLMGYLLEIGRAHV